MVIPTIETSRLVLRPPMQTDWARYYSFMASDRAKYMGGPYSEQSAWGQFCHDVAQWTLMGHGALMIQCQKCGNCLAWIIHENTAFSLVPCTHSKFCSVGNTTCIPLLRRIRCVHRVLRDNTMFHEQSRLGQVGINYGPLFPERELGWFVYEDFEGQGYAFEAARALLDWAFEVRNYSTLVSYIDPDNSRSVSLALKLGAKPDSEALVPEEGDLVYRHTRSALTGQSNQD